MWFSRSGARMKRLIALLLVLVMMAPFASADVITSAVFLNGQELSFTDDKGMALSPVLMNGRLYAPAEELGRQLYVEVKADPKRLTLTVAGKPMTLKAGGQDVPAVLVDDVVYIPVLLFADATGFDIVLEGTNYYLTSEAIRDYQTGLAALKAGEYDKACTAFARAGKFSDAPVRIQEARYLQAEMQLANGLYDSASQSFKKAGTYKDAASRVGEPWYVQAELQMAKSDYVAAADSFKKAGTYKDAAARIGEAWYLQGKQLFAQGKMADASAAYKKAGNYKDAASLAVGVYADDGIRKMNAGDLKGAFSAFTHVADTAEGKQYLAQVLYMLAKKQQDAGKTEQAITLYQLVSDYSDAKTLLAATYYKQGSTAEAAGKTAAAIEAYKNAGNYQDAQDKWKKLTYDQAKKHQANQKYDDAYALFDTIRGYSDVDNRLSTNTNLKNAAKKAESKKLAAEINKGDTFKFGSYAHVDSGSTRKQTIEWKVLKVDGSKLYLVSKYVLEKKPYHTSNTKTINWSNCSLRTWLNNTFLQNAFTQAERNAIVSTSITSKTSTGSTTTTKDKIFLPTYSELNSNLEKADLKPSNKKNVKVIAWSRDRYTGMSYSSTAYAQTISASGDSSYQKVTGNQYVRPAMWVDLDTNYDWSNCIVKTTAKTTDQYASIKQMMAKGQYKNALDALGKKPTSTEVNELTRECRYQLGCEALRNGDLATATQYFNVIKRFQHKDSVVLLTVIDLLK